MEFRVTRENGRQEGSSFYHIGDGYHYHYVNESVTTIYFRCRSTSCGGRALFKFGRGFHHSHPHNHGPNILYTDVLAHRQAVMAEARSMEYVSFSDIIRTEMRRIPNVEVRRQITYRQLRSAMQRARAGVFPILPEDLGSLSRLLRDPAMEYLCSTIDLQDNIYLGPAVATDGSHSTVFVSNRCIELLRSSNILFADGTFFITPSVDGCYQVFTIVTIYGHTVIPLCWCLMESKSQAAYESILLLIRARVVWWRFTRVVSDFEDAIINAFWNVFGVMAQGCLFHAADAMVRHAKAHLGLVIIRQYEEVDIVIRLCCALPLLPQHLLQRGLDIIGTEAMNMGPIIYGIVRAHLVYVQRDWLDHANRGATMSVCESDHRTNNASESNNRRMKRKFGVHHPNVFQFIREVANFEQESVDDVASLSIALIPTRHRSVSAVSNDRFIIQITNELLREEDPSDESILRFLSGCALAIKGIIDDELN